MRRVSRPMLHAVILAMAVSTALYATLLPSRAITSATVIFDSPVGTKIAGAPVFGKGELAFASIGATDLGLPVNPAHARIPAFENPLDSLKEADTPPLGQQEANLLSSEFDTVPAGVDGRTQRPACDSGVSKLYCVYTVQKGDALASIASQFGMLGTSDVAPWQLLVQSNKPEIASEDDVLKVGQKLRIPLENAVIHTVLSSETLIDIAERYDISSSAIAQLAGNGIEDMNALRIGQELLVPNPARLNKPAPAVTPTMAPSTRPSTTDTSDLAGPGMPKPAANGQTSQSRFVWPASGPLSSYYGPSHPLGIDVDLYATPSAPNVAAAGGTVTFAGGDACCSYGYYVVVDHGNGFQSLYAHFSKLSVSVGQRVAQGEVLGLAGRTGYATGNHLHFELRLNGSIVNPIAYLP